MSQKSKRTATKWVGDLMWTLTKDLARETGVFADSLVNEAGFAITGETKRKTRK